MMAEYAWVAKCSDNTVEKKGTFRVIAAARKAIRLQLFPFAIRKKRW